MIRFRRHFLPAVTGMLLLAAAGALFAADVSLPRFVADLSKEKTPGHAVNLDVDVRGKTRLFLVTTGSGYADWAEPRLVGSFGEIRLTKARWQFADVGWDMVRVNMNSWGRPLTVNGQKAEYAMAVHSPSMIVYDLPPGSARFRARAALDDGGSAATTFAVYVDNPLLDVRNAAIWRRLRSSPPQSETTAFIEMFGGDRLPGDVVDYPGGDASGGDLAGPHFLVQPRLGDGPFPESKRSVRVLEAFVRRIVRTPVSRRVYTPGTVFFKDGRTLSFRAIRFDGGSAKLLRQNEVSAADMADVAEIHLPAGDPWESFFEQRAILCPGGRSPVVYLETAAGAKLSASRQRICTRGHGPANKELSWWAVVQPAWCLDPLCVANDSIVSRTILAPHQVPLSRVLPAEVRSGGVFSRDAFSRQIDRSVQGGLLESGGKSYRWGFGVHAPSELTFPLPAGALTFRTHAGLNRTAGDGGCVRVRVFADSTGEKPLYESPLLIGSQNVVDCGSVRLSSAGTSPKQLVLQVDPVYEGRPKKADPLDIRDALDWLEPILELDPGRFRAEVAKRTENTIPAWRDWTVADGRRSYGLVNYWNNVAPWPSRFQAGIVPKEGALTLTRQVRVTEDNNWLVLSVNRPWTHTGKPATIEIHADGETVSKRNVPIRDSDRPNPVPLVVSLSKYIGKDVKIEIVQSSGGEPSAVHWEALQITNRIPTLLCLFEDGGTFQSVGAKPAAEALLVEDRHMGDRAVKIAAPGRFRLGRPGEVFRIREFPDWGEYRYLRFAFRKVGAGRVCLELEHADQEQRPARYDGGQGPPCYGGATRFWQLNLPDAWIVETVDLHESFGNLDVTGLVLGVPDGQYALLDHIHLARATEDFNRLPNHPSPEETNRHARTVLASFVRERALPATVAFDRGSGKWGTGIIIDGRAGLIVTAGHIIAGKKKEIDVHLADGRAVKGRQLGIDRANDIGLIRLVEKGPWPHVQIDFQHRDSFPRDMLHLAIAHPKVFRKGREPTAYICNVTGIREGKKLLVTDFRFGGHCRGGPLLDKDAKLIGVHSRINTPSAECLYVKPDKFAASWERLVKGESFGTWPPHIGPRIGVVVQSTKDGCRVIGVDPDSPAKDAGIQVNDAIFRIDDTRVTQLGQMQAYLAPKDPDAEVTLHVRRGDKTRNVKIRLMQYRMLHAEPGQ